MAKDIIKISDDEDTASEADVDLQEAVLHPARKRKLERSSGSGSRSNGNDVLLPDITEKVQWTDESDTVPAKPKKRRARASKRKSGGRRGDRRYPTGREGSDDDHDDDDTGLADIPEYVQSRRRTFDAATKTHHEAALMLPPDYTDVDLSVPGEHRNGALEERPQFDPRSGIKPCRPYEDVELPQSAGLIPAPIAQYLRDYQIAGVSFLHRKFVYQQGAILGDDMGLGKTVQVAAFLTAAFGKMGDETDGKRMRQMRFYNDRWYPRILIVCPGSLLMNWKNELHRWGWWHVDLYHGLNKDDVLGTARAGLLEIMITTYDTYKNSRSSINLVKWDAVIADECHRLKDRYSATTKAMQEVNALCRIGLSGTAIQNRYEELWTLLDWTNPGSFGTLVEWKNTISKPLAVGQSHEATAAQLSLARQTATKLVHNLLPRYFLRRMKTLIADQLPKKMDRVVFCPLTDLQLEAYTNFLESANVQQLLTVSETCEHGKARGWCCATHLPSGVRWQNIVFPSMIVLQKLANHLTLLIPQSTDLDDKQKSELQTLQTCCPETWRELYSQRDQLRNLANPGFCGKWLVLKKLLKFWHGGRDKVLVFSHSVRLLRILQHLFSNTHYTVSYLDGSLSYEARQDVVDTFNSDPTQFVFLISTKAGGVGLNITSANKVVIMDPHWNPSYDLQAQDRAYRIGQTRDVEVFRLISISTVEEIVYARQVYKQQQANIGYTASSERRYFKGVQQDQGRKGEIFGLGNIFTYHGASALLREIVNKTNIAEAKAGVTLTGIDMDQAAKDEETADLVKDEDTGIEDGGMSQFAKIVTAEDKEKLLKGRKSTAPKMDAVQAILTSAGVEYTHDNAEVIGSSKVEEQLSRRAAEMACADGLGTNTLFAGSQEDDVYGDSPHSVYNPPEEVKSRQFCEMAKEFGFATATEFALVVESWTQEERRSCLDTFYERRKQKLAGDAGAEQEKPKTELDDKREVKAEAKTEAKNESESKLSPLIKREHKLETAMSSNNVKDEFKREGNHHEQPVKDEPEIEKKPIKNQLDKDEKLKKKLATMERGSSKRTSIFLSSDEEDEL